MVHDRQVSTSVTEASFGDERVFTAPSNTAYVYTQVQYFGDEDGKSEFPPFDLERLKERNFVHASAFVRADLVGRYGYCEELRAGWEDWDLWLTLAEHGWTGVLVD